jgi:hypothetical protein
MSGAEFRTLLDGLASFALLIHVVLFVVARVLDWQWDRKERERRSKAEAEHAAFMVEIAFLKTELRRAEREAGIPPRLTLVKKEDGA